MNVGITAQLTDRGQVVVPANFRKILGLNGDSLVNFLLQGEGLYLQPVRTVPVLSGDNTSALMLLKKIQGSWGEKTAEDKNNEAKIRKLEISAVKKSKNSW